MKWKNMKSEERRQMLRIMEEKKERIYEMWYDDCFFHHSAIGENGGK